ncbi:MAG: carboxypeptidase-like regulatory domain-containing protein [Candidatus Solibacter sp.]
MNRRFLLMTMASLVAGWGATREVKGSVSDQNGKKLARAVVYLKDTRTLMIRSYLSRKSGAYRFVGLNPDVDYELYARFRSVTSATTLLSRFDSAKVAAIDLVVEVSQ